MPKIFEYFGIVLYFYSNEHEPIHIHIAKSEYESIFDLIMENGKLKDIKCRNKAGVEPLPESDMKVAKEFVQKYALEIVDKWVKFFVLKEKVKMTKITKRI